MLTFANNRWEIVPVTLEEGAALRDRFLVEVAPLRGISPPAFQEMIKAADASTPESKRMEEENRRTLVAQRRNYLCDKITSNGGVLSEWVFLSCREYARKFGTRFFKHTGDHEEQKKIITDFGYRTAWDELMKYEISPSDIIRVDKDEFMSDDPMGYLVKMTAQAFHAKMAGVEFLKISEII